VFELDGYAPIIIAGIKNTLMVGLSAMCLAIVFGLIGAWAKTASSWLIRGFANIYTTVVRGVPELILLLLFYYGFPQLVQDLAESFGYELLIDLNPFLAGTLTIGFIYGAFCTEVFRGAFASIPPGQAESAKALGMTESLMYRRILLPQVMYFALPGLGNVWLVLIKATALISIIQLDEIMRMAKIAANATREPFTAYFLASLLFLAITVVSMIAQHYLEKKWSRAGAH
jgi:polar amino acid transport system permease protein/octopine/nopaline transport system permease protein/arginine/ornithine transport system permease protein